MILNRFADPPTPAPSPAPPETPAPSSSSSSSKKIGRAKIDDVGFQIQSDEEARKYGRALGRWYGKKGGRPKNQPPEAGGGGVFALPGKSGEAPPA